MSLKCLDQCNVHESSIDAVKERICSLISLIQSSKTFWRNGNNMSTDATSRERIYSHAEEKKTVLKTH